jgi:hypothetical protein
LRDLFLMGLDRAQALLEDFAHFWEAEPIRPSDAS